MNTECVATSIVANRDFSLPSADDLSAMVGPRKSVDLNSFLAANLRVLTDAADYLGNRYRDTYDFAPTFGRRQPGADRVELASDTPNALLATPSPKALRWDLSPVDPYMTEDSGLSLLLRARRPTRSRGAATSCSCAFATTRSRASCR